MYMFIKMLFGFFEVFFKLSINFDLWMKIYNFKIKCRKAS